MIRLPPAAARPAGLDEVNLDPHRRGQVRV